MTAPATAPVVEDRLRPVTPIAILADRLTRLVDALPPTGPDPGWVQELREARDLAAGLDPYLSACTTAESAALRRLTELTVEVDWAGSGATAPLEAEMLSGHVEGQLLKVLVRATRARRVLEIGTFTGYSALAMAEALPPDGEVVACEIDPTAAAFAAERFADSPHGHRVSVRVGPALHTLHRLADERVRFDLVFLDADKAGYQRYLDTLLDRDLLTDHAVVCVDNTLMQGQPYGAGEGTANGRAIREFNQAVQADPRVEQVLLPLRDGVTLICRVDGDAA